MRIVKDEDLCEGHAQCEAVAPMHFSVDDDDYMTVIEPNVTDETLPLVEQAVARCPRAALSLVEN